MKKLSAFVIAVLFLLLSSSASKAYRVPTDPGRLSLVQAENGQIINQRDGSFLFGNFYNPYFVQGRTPYRSALFVATPQQVMSLIGSGDISLSQGTISFWTLKNNWSEKGNDFFFRTDVASSFVPNDDLEIRTYSDGNMYSGFAFVRAVVGVSTLDPSRWHLITFTFKTGDNIRLFVDGVLSATGPVYDGIANFNSSSSCATGYLCWGGWPGAYSARAAMEDMQIFNYPLTQQQIQNIYNSTTPVAFYSHIYPTIDPITFSSNPLTVNTRVDTNATFSETGYTGTHNATWNWGDGNTSQGTVTGTSSGTISGTHIYATAGVYTVSVTLTDSEGDGNTSTYQYLSVYEPTSQGIFSAASRFTSPLGAYTANPNLTGNVKFGLSYKYQGGVPVSNREFTMNFASGNFLFDATTVNSLVISGNTATLTGNGTLNGVGNYSFTVVGIATGSIRVQIKDTTNNVVYDTQPNEPITNIPTTLVSGNVIIH